MPQLYRVVFADIAYILKVEIHLINQQTCKSKQNIKYSYNSNFEKKGMKNSFHI